MWTLLLQTKSLADLHSVIKHRINESDPPPEIKLEYGTNVYIEDKKDKFIYKELYDGATLVARYVKITVTVNVGKRNYSVHPLRV